MEDNANRKTKLPLIIGLLGVGTGVWFAVMGIPGGSSLSPNELVSLTNRGLASVENIPNKLENDGTPAKDRGLYVTKDRGPELFTGPQILATLNVCVMKAASAQLDTRRAP